MLANRSANESIGCGLTGDLRMFLFLETDNLIWQAVICGMLAVPFARK